MVGASSRAVRQAAKLESALSDLEGLDLDALRARWQSLTGRPPPATVRTPLLRAAVAYKLQERVHGGLKASTRNLLHRVADAADPARRKDQAGPAGPDPALVGSAVPSPMTARRAASPPLRVKAGTRLLRSWRGSTHEVLVGENGVTYRGQAYRSLSEVARIITGQRWSGPLFFGLKRRAAAGAEPSP